MKRKQVGVAVAVLLAVALAGVGFAGATGAWSGGPGDPLGPPVVDPSVPGHELLQDALRIDAAFQHGGNTHFAYMPAKRPPDLQRMEEIENNDRTIDLYEVGTAPVHTVVAYTVTSPGPCPPAAPEAVCLRSGPVDGVSPDAPSLRYAKVQMTGGAKPGDPVTNRATRFWAKTGLVPIRRAVWFAELVQEARAAAGRP